MELVSDIPDLSKEADGWDPRSVTAGSGIERRWRCSLGHSYVASPNQRKKGSGCPYCSGRRVLSGFNDLQTRFPNIAKEACGWDPATSTPFSSKDREWECPAGHVYTAPPSRRCSNGSGCPYCASRKVLAGLNDLATTDPELSSEADGWDPSTVTSNSSTRLPWRCQMGHTWETSPGSRHRSDGKISGCPYCAGSRVWQGFNDLQTLHPDIAREANGWDPSLFLAGGNTPREWTCPEGHTYKATIARRVNYGAGCTVCSGATVLPGFNDLKSQYPDVAKQLVDADPESLSKHSGKKATWRCEEGHEWEAAVYARTRLSQGCPYCSGAKAIVGETDLATKHPGIAAEAFGWDPSTVSFGSGLTKLWTCPKGHPPYKATVVSRTNGGQGCNVCAGKVVLAGVNDLKSSYPHIAEQAHNWDPATVAPRSSTVREWICSMGHTWKATPANRTSQDQDCPFCVGKRVWPGFNDVQTLSPLVAKEAFGWDPKIVLNGSKSKKRWRCEKGHEWDAVVASRTGKRQLGCPSCSVSGYRPALPGYLYLMQRPGEQQIGISNVPQQRLAVHHSNGWELIEIRGPGDGLEVREIEAHFKLWLRSNSRLVEGASESWSSSSLSITSLLDLWERSACPLGLPVANYEAFNAQDEDLDP